MTLKAIATAAGIAAGVLACAGQAQAAVNVIVNGSFEADFGGWTESENAYASTLAPGGLFAPSNSGSDRTYGVPNGARFAVVTGNAPDTPVTLTQTFELTYAMVLSGWAAFVAYDGLPFNDEVSVYLEGFADTPLFASNVAAVGDQGDTPWTSFSIELQPGVYTLVASSTNILDGAVASSLLLDNVRLTGVPEPAAWVMMIGGFFGAGALLRGRRGPLAA